MLVKTVALRPAWSSAGIRTFEAEINGVVAGCPQGLSRSPYEARGVSQSRALRAFAKIKKQLIGKFNQAGFDAVLQSHARELGSSATTALSLAFFAASEKKLNTFPFLLGNVLGGGAHAKTKMAIQEILVIPRARNFPRVVDDLFEIWNEVGERLKNAALNHEGAWSVDIDEKSAMDIVYQVAHGHHADLGVDFAANQMWNNGYRWSDCNLSRDRHIERVLEFIADYNLIYVEDPLHADDWTGFAKIKESAKRALICGDDLTATNLGRIKTAIDMRAVSAAIIKPNQTGTVSGALAAIDMCKKNGIVPIVSHRSSETTDTAICGLAQLTPFAKLGISGIRIVKLNELLRRWYRTKKPKMTYLKI